LTFDNSAAFPSTFAAVESLSAHFKAWWRLLIAGCFSVLESVYREVACSFGPGFPNS
jgi:hypothetical protein